MKNKNSSKLLKKKFIIEGEVKVKREKIKWKRKFSMLLVKNNNKEDLYSFSRY